MIKQYRYFAVGEKEMKGGLYLTSAGYNIAPPRREYPASGHPQDFHFTWARGRILTDTALVCITNGHGTFETKIASHDWPAGNAILLPPGIWHRYRPAMETGWTEFWLTLNGEWMGRFWELHDPALPLSPLPVSGLRRFLNKFRRFHELALRPQAVSAAPQSLELLGLGLELVGQFVDEHLESPPSPPSDNLTDTTIRFIWKNSHRPLTAPQIASAMGVSRRTLERHFARRPGRTVREELEWHRVQRAQQLLEETRRPIKEIAYLCGFREQRSLIRAFKRWQHRLPSSVRGPSQSG